MGGTTSAWARQVILKWWRWGIPFLKGVASLPLALVGYDPVLSVTAFFFFQVIQIFKKSEKVWFLSGFDQFNSFVEI